MSSLNTSTSSCGIAHTLTLLDNGIHSSIQDTYNANRAFCTTFFVFAAKPLLTLIATTLFGRRHRKSHRMHKGLRRPINFGSVCRCVLLFGAGSVDRTRQMNSRKIPKDDMPSVACTLVNSTDNRAHTMTIHNATVVKLTFNFFFLYVTIVAK